MTTHYRLTKLQRLAYLLLGTLALQIASANLSASDWVVGKPMHSLVDPSGALVPTQGKITLVDFWASWCVPCKASFPEMDALNKTYQKQGFQVVAVNLDANIKAMEGFLAKRNVSFAIIRDESQELIKSAGIETFPTSFLVDKAGVIRYVHEGWHGKKSKEELESEIQKLLSES